MHSRLPLSLVLSSLGRRHAIPHATFTAASTSPFFCYLDSNDTRLPAHPTLLPYAHPAEDYNTYVGEEVWDRPSGDGTDKAATDEAPADDLRFDAVVAWVWQVWEREDWAKDGVVLCGRYCVANDCAWAVSSNSPVIFTPRELFMVMRNSVKFLRDIHTQLHSSSSGNAEAEFTIAKALAGEGAKEMRVFLPYRLTTNENNELHLSPPLEHYAAVCQRLTDVCFPSLMDWSEEEHHENFKVILKRIQQAQLLERAYATNGKLLPKLKEAFIRRVSRTTGSTKHQSGTAQRGESQNLILMLAVDILFEGSSFPIYILSAKMRLFFVKLADSLNQEVGSDKDAVVGDLPYIKELLNSDSDDNDICDTNDLNINDDVSSFSSLSSISENDETNESLLEFFRLIRDPSNWNRYVRVMAERYASSFTSLQQTCNIQDEAGSPCLIPLEEGNPMVNHYCIVASDPMDLITCRGDLRMRGLPLEFIDPQLLQANPEAMEFLRNMRDALVNNQSEPSSC
ncbi:unnamed protein product, partial [Phytomonas sp. Hart1]